MTAPINCIGVKFGKLTGVSEAEPRIRKDRGTKVRQILCKCDCGTDKVVPVPDLRSGNTVSCGCFLNEVRGEASITHGATRGLSKGIPATTEYHSWCGMIARCEDEHHISYQWYGARGIKVCARWRISFESFLADMGEKPTKGHSIERIKSDGDYCPENCKWATGEEQFANSRAKQIFLDHARSQ